MAYNLLVHHQVADYNQWKPVFDEDGANRKSHGAQSGILFRNADNPNEIFALWEFDSAEHAKEFAQDPSLRETMQRAGVVGRPDIYYLDEVGPVV